MVVVNGGRMADELETNHVDNPGLILVLDSVT